MGKRSRFNRADKGGWGKKIQSGGRDGGNAGGRDESESGSAEGQGGDGGGEDENNSSSAAGGTRGTSDDRAKGWAFADNLRPTRNADLEKYYKAQGFITDEEEWGRFLTALAENLPVTFRVNPLSPSADSVRERLATDPVWTKPFTLTDGRTVESPRRLTWFPEAYQVGCGKPDLRKSDTLRSFHAWLVAQTEEGAVSRQEAVSMIPPLLLRVQPHHTVLDMCAAPGSKTAQLIEALHTGELEGVAASGMVVANDADAKRAYLLTHQCSRIGSPALVVTCHDAQVFPNLYNKNIATAGGAEEASSSSSSSSAAAAAAAAEPTSAGQRTPGCFDRVLADVPCSGDGTARKNADIFTKWSPSGGLALHPLQIQIAMRGLALLKVGGYMAYSTCSLNPVEDEAVVSELLRRCNGAVELEDASHVLPNLKYSPGLSTWTIMDKDMVTYTSWEQSQKPNAHGHVTKSAKKLHATVFPPPPEVAASYHLERCMRVLPHLQDTGGFFICLLKKTAPLPSAKPWYQPSAASSSTGAAAAASSSSSSSAAAAPAAASSKGADSEDEIDQIVTRPYYGRAGPATGDMGVIAGAVSAAAASTGPAAAGAGPAAEAAEEEVEAVEGGEDSEGEGGEQEEEGGATEKRARTEEPAASSSSAPAAASSSASSSSTRAAVGRPGQAPGVLFFVPPKKPSQNEMMRDSRGRTLTGRHEVSNYMSADPLAVTELAKTYGLMSSFPINQLYSRSETSRSIILVANPIADLVLSQQKTTAGEGRVKTINTGILVFMENKGEKHRQWKNNAAGGGAAAADGDDEVEVPSEGGAAASSSSAAAGDALATTDASASSSSSSSSQPHHHIALDFRIMQDGVLFLLPYMTRQVVHVSGNEIAAILRFRSQFVNMNVYPKRIQKILEYVTAGSFVMVLNPALDGCEESEEALPTPLQAGIPPLSAAYDIDLEAKGAFAPKLRIPKDALAVVPPALRSNYSSADAEGMLTYTPAIRVWPGADSLSRIIVAMWKGKARCNVMVHAKEAETLVRILKDRGYAAE